VFIADNNEAIVAPPAPATNIHVALELLEAHLARELDKNTLRQDSFDMDDAPEAQALTPFPELKAGLDWLEENVTVPWRDADKEALHSQTLHKWLALVAIIGGFGAIILAIIQLAIKATATTGKLETASVVLEVFTAFGAAIAVGFGVYAKVNHHWLEQRNLAERLRMLKYSALVQFCSLNADWQGWVKNQLDAIKQVPDFQKVKAWSEGGDVDPAVPSGSKCDPQSGSFGALVLYYQYKRILFQAQYFERRRGDYQGKIPRWLHPADLPIFFLSVFLVVVHIVAQHFADHPIFLTCVHWGTAAVWFGASAAILPILSLGIHSWVGAFELPRSASLCLAKKQALEGAAMQLRQDSGNALGTIGHMSNVEHFLEQEHREWLRLIIETKWFV
jgi:hypothetical protein